MLWQVLQGASLGSQSLSFVLWPSKAFSSMWAVHWLLLQPSEACSALPTSNFFPQRQLGVLSEQVLYFLWMWLPLISVCLLEELRGLGFQIVLVHSEVWTPCSFSGAQVGTWGKQNDLETGCLGCFIQAVCVLLSSSKFTLRKAPSWNASHMVHFLLEDCSLLFSGPYWFWELMSLVSIDKGVMFNIWLHS